MDLLRLFASPEAAHPDVHFGGVRRERIGAKVCVSTHHRPSGQPAAKAVELLGFNAILQNRKG